jgi:hypothetical protein
MSDNKPKIDLKARLGKKTVATPGASVPPPAGIQRPSVPAAGLPRPSAPVGPGMSQVPRSPSAVPAPPFAQPSAGPRVDPTNPYASMPQHSAPVQARPQEIRVDMDEVRAAQRSGRGKVIALAAITAVVGGVIGFAFGGGSERGKGADAAIEGAKLLAKEVDDSNKSVGELAEVLKSARTKLLNKGTYPQEEITKLGAINLPLRSTSLADKSIGRFKRETLTMLIDYTAAIEEANDQKETLQRILGSNAVKELVEEQKSPKVRWVGYVSGGPSGPWISLDRVDSPFLVQSTTKVKDKDGKETDYTWPEEIEVKDGKNTSKVKRYSSGDPAGSTPPFIPVNPQSQAGVCPSDVIGSLLSQLLKMDAALRGDSTPGVDKVGLIERGQKLSEALKKIGKT